MPNEMRCKLCARTFVRSLHKLKYCSLECSIQGNKEITQVGFRAKRAEKQMKKTALKVCQQCKQEFKPWGSRTQIFCSKNCCKAHERLQWVTRTKR